jgi:hypothetical protein
MPLFGLIKNKKKTKDQPSTPEDDKESTHSSTVAAGAATDSNSSATTKTTSDTTKSSSANKKLNKVKSDQSSLTPVQRISNKTPNPFTAAPVNIPKSPTLGLSAPADGDSTRMYSSSPFSTSPQQPPINQHQHLQQSQQQQQQPQQQQQQQQHHLQNVVTGQYNAPPTPPSTARSGSIDDKIDLNPSITNTGTTQLYQHDQLKHPQPQQGYQQYTDDSSAEAMIATPSGLLTPVPNANDRVIPSRFPSAQTGNAVRTTKGKYSIVDFSIQRTLGTGSFGRVHLAQSRHNSRFYAIKVGSPCHRSIVSHDRSSKNNRSSK